MAQSTYRDPAELLRRRIAESGLSARRFAVEVLKRDERAVRRWMAEKESVPRIIVEFLESPDPAPWP